MKTRERVGDWEGDLVVGAPGTGNLVTLVERKTRFALVGRVQSKEAEEVSDLVAQLFSLIPKAVQQTLTFDNGKEFAIKWLMRLRWTCSSRFRIIFGSVGQTRTRTA